MCRQARRSGMLRLSWQLGGERLRTKDGGNEVQDGLQIDTERVVTESPQDVQPRLNPAAAGAIVGKGDQPAAREAAPGLDLDRLALLRVGDVDVRGALPPVPTSGRGAARPVARSRQ